MSIEKELTELAQKMFNEQQKFLLDQKPLNDAVAAYVRDYAVQELEKIKDKLMTQDVIGRSLGQVVIDSLDYIDEAIAALKGDNQPNN